jgi:universal stress protein A
VFNTTWRSEVAKKKEIPMLAPKTILHPNDCTKHAEDAFHLASALSQQYGARLILLYVKEPQETVVGEFGSIPPEPEPTDDQYLQSLQQMAASNASLKAECLVVEGIPVNEILRVAQEVKCDLIVLGSHAHSWLGRLMTGDVVEKVANKASCHVVTVRSPR